MRSALVIAAAGVAALAVVAVGSARDAGRIPIVDGFVVGFGFDARSQSTVYTAMLDGRVYKTPDAGRSWRSIADLGWSRIDAFAHDAGRPGTLYAGTGEAVYKTVNGGRSWRGASRGLLPPPPVIAPGQVTATPGHREAEGWVTALVVDPKNSDVVYAGTGGGVRKSIDGGRSWRTVLWRGRFMAVSALVIAPTNPQVVYAAGFHSWPSNCGIPGRIRCRQSSWVQRTANGGRTWQATTLPETNPVGYPTRLALDPRQPTTLYVAAGHAVLTSADAGRSWRSITDGLPEKRQVTSLAVDPRQSGTLYIGLWNGGIFKTTDSGRTWSNAIAGFPVTALAVDPTQPSTIYAGVAQRDYAVMRSTDSGNTWTIAG